MDPEPNIIERRRQQRLVALEWANKVRQAQSEMKKRLRAGKIDPVMMLEGRDPTWSRFAMEVRVGGMLHSIPRLGRETVRAVMSECDLFPDDRLQDATQEQRDRLVELVRMLLER